MRSGLTLVEVLVAVLILSFGLLGLAAEAGAVSKAVALNGSRDKHAAAARDSLELIRSKEP